MATVGTASAANNAGGTNISSTAAAARQQEFSEKMQSVAAELQKIETELQNCVEVRQRLDSQLTENEQVKKEFAVLKASDVVYKLVGPALLKQEQNEAKQNVDKRINFIQAEIKRVESLLKEINERSEKKRLEVVAIQQAAQQVAAATAEG